MSSTPQAVMPIALACVASACTPLPDDEYRGEPLATVFGTVHNMLAEDPPPLEVALAWFEAATAGMESPRTFGVLAPVRGTFPSDFELRIYLPPPAETLADLDGEAASDESPFAIGFLTVTRAGSTRDGEVDPDDVIGAAIEHAIAYVEADVVEGTVTAGYLGGPLTAGYHLMRSEAEGMFVEADAGFATRVHVVLGMPDDPGGGS